jgi:hypothetical protein
VITSGKLFDPLIGTGVAVLLLHGAVGHGAPQFPAAKKQATPAATTSRIFRVTGWFGSVAGVFRLGFGSV